MAVYLMFLHKYIISRHCPERKYLFIGSFGPLGSGSILRDIRIKTPTYPKP